MNDIGIQFNYDDFAGIYMKDNSRLRRLRSS